MILFIDVTLALFGIGLVIYWMLTDFDTLPSEYREKRPGRILALRILTVAIVIVSVIDLVASWFPEAQTKQTYVHPSPRPREHFEPGPLLTYQSIAGSFGFSICYEGRGYSFLADGISELDIKDTRAHEAKHREQYARFRDCPTFEAWYQTPAGHLESEAEAAHAGWCASLAGGADTVSARALYIERIADYVGATRDATAKRFDHYGGCS